MHKFDCTPHQIYDHVTEGALRPTALSENFSEPERLSIQRHYNRTGTH